MKKSSNKKFEELKTAFSIGDMFMVNGEEVLVIGFLETEEDYEKVFKEKDKFTKSYPQLLLYTTGKLRSSISNIILCREPYPCTLLAKSLLDNGLIQKPKSKALFIEYNRIKIKQEIMEALND